MQCLPFVATFRSLNLVVHSCFGNALKLDFEKHIQKFKSDYLALDLPVTPKIHCIFYYIAEFCKMSNKGPGFYNEQASETVHGDFNRLWTNYKVSSFENPRYKEQFLKAVQMYNSRHLL